MRLIWLAGLTGAPGYLWAVTRIFVTFHAVCFAWCFFRLTDLPESIACVKKWFVFDADKMLVGDAADPALWLLLTAYAIATLAAVIVTRGNTLPEVADRFPVRPLAQGLMWGGAFGLLVLAGALHEAGQTTPFIYFQF